MLRYWLIDLPAALTSRAWATWSWFQLGVIIFSATVLPATVALILILYFGFGIRWGW